MSVVGLADAGFVAVWLGIMPGSPGTSPVDVNSDFNENPSGRSRPWEGDLAWTGDSWLVAWMAAIFPYDQYTIYVRRFAKQ